MVPPPSFPPPANVPIFLSCHTPPPLPHTSRAPFIDRPEDDPQRQFLVRLLTLSARLNSDPLLLNSLTDASAPEFFDLRHRKSVPDFRSLPFASHPPLTPPAAKFASFVVEEGANVVGKRAHSPDVFARLLAARAGTLGVREEELMDLLACLLAHQHKSSLLHAFAVVDK
jgi:hypothetical protein